MLLNEYSRKNRQYSKNFQKRALSIIPDNYFLFVAFPYIVVEKF